MLPDRVLQTMSERTISKVGQQAIEQIAEKQEFDKGQLQTLQMICKGIDKCPYGTDCPLQQPEEHKRCQLEIVYQEKWYNEYQQQYGIEHNDKRYQSILTTLISIEIQLMRQQQIISKEGFEQIVVTETEDGKKKYDKKLHNVLQLIDKLEDRKLKVIKELKDVQVQQQTQQLLGDITQLFNKK